MVRFLVFILFFYSTYSFAFKATITVLEAPLFAFPDETSKVIQYHRKGELIYIHPHEEYIDNFKDRIDDLSKGITADSTNDPLFKDNKAYIPNPESKFYKTISRDGNEAWVLKEHVFINFKDAREFNQTLPSHDQTDYRISEPLNKNYPFEDEIGYKGQSQFALGVPNFRTYPFRENISDTEINFSKEFNFIWSKAVKENEERRFFIGAFGGVHFSSTDYLLRTQQANQENIRISIGPMVSYDLLRDFKRGLNIYFSIQTSLMDTMKVSVKSQSLGEKEDRQYFSVLPLSSVMGLNMQFYKLLSTFDGVIGSNIRLNLPKNYQATNTGSVSSFWNSTEDTDSFYQPLSAEINFFFGLQSYY